MAAATPSVMAMIVVIIVLATEAALPTRKTFGDFLDIAQPA
jgi:hypothetical protein